MFRQKSWLLLAATVCFAVVLVSVLLSGSGDRAKPSVGPGSEVDEPEPETGQTEKQLKLAVSMPSKPFALLQQLKDQFESSHPGVKVALENIPNETAYAKWKKAAQLGEAPDVMLLDNSWVSEFAALGYLQPVDSLLTGGLQAEQLEQALAQVKWNGYLWGVPKHLDTYVAVYNTKRLNEWGAKTPATADELLALHKQTLKPDEGKYGVYFDTADGEAFVRLVHLLGGAKTVSKTSPADWTDSAVRKSLESFLYVPAEEPQALGKSFPPESVTWKPWEQLAQVKLTGYLTTFSDWKQNESAAFTMSALPLPAGEALVKGPWLTGESFAITAKSAASKEAFELIRELVSADASLKFWNAAGHLPAQSGFYVPAIKEDAAFQIVAPYIDNDAAAPAMPQRARQIDALQAGLAQLWKGEVAFNLFLDRTAAAWNDIHPAPAAK